MNAGAEKHYRAFMEACGIPTDTPHSKDTPRRVAKMFGELTEGLRPKTFAFTSFPKQKGHSYDQLIILKDIPVYSTCAHHHVPFHGVAHVGYLPSKSIIGLSKIVRLVQWCSRKPTIQEDLTQEIAAELVSALKPLAACVMIEAEHQCIGFRGARAPGVKTVTHCLRGKLGVELKQEFLSIVRG